MQLFYLHVSEVDECTLGFHTCHIDAVCMDIRVGFNCTCPHTYDDTYGDGTMCTGNLPSKLLVSGA